MAVGATEARRRDRLSAVARIAGSAWLLLPLALAATLALQITTLNYYFFEDDYVPFGEIVTRGTGGYLHHLFLSQDLTPNWRVIPGLIYLGSYKTSGMNPMTMHAVILAFHVGTTALLYYATWRVTRLPWAAAVAAVIFGMNAAYTGTLSQVTAITHVNGAFFLVATLVAVIECAFAEERGRANLWLGASVVLYVLAIASNEAMAIIFPVYGLAHLLLDPRREGRLARAIARTAPLAAIGIATAIAFTTCGCNEAARVYGRENAAREYVLYLGRLLYPVGLEGPRYIDTPHRVAAALLLGLTGYVVASGGPLGRIGALWMLLAIVPHVLVHQTTATRYTYLPAPGFALVVTAGAMMAAPAVARIDRRLPWLAGAPLLAVLATWYSVETIRQNRFYDVRTAEWHDLYRQATRVYPEVPPLNKVEILGGPVTHPIAQFFVLPSFAQTTWGPLVTMGSYASDSEPAGIARISTNPYVAEYHDGVLVPVKPVPSPPAGR